MAAKRKVSVKKFGREQLSRILSAHAGKQLVPGGSVWWAPHFGMSGCILQVACNEPQPAFALNLNRKIAVWFDIHYNSRWTIDRLVAELDKNGFI